MSTETNNNNTNVINEKDQLNMVRNNLYYNGQIRSMKNIEKLAEQIAASFTFDYELIDEAKKRIRVGEYSVTYDMTNLLHYRDNMNYKEIHAYNDFMRPFFQSMYDNQREVYKELCERRVLFHFLMSAKNPYRYYRIKKATRPDFILCGEKSVGVEITKLTTEHDEVLFSISRQTSGKGLSVEEMKRHVAKYHKRAIGQYEYYDIGGTTVIDSKMQNLHGQRVMYAEQIMKKYELYKEDISQFDDFIVLGDTTTGAGLAVTEKWEVDEIIKELCDMCPQITIPTIVIVWETGKSTKKYYSWYRRRVDD